MMKYYVYVSDSKVDMLYNQLAVPMRERLATELKIDLKILSASFSEKEPEVTRYSKLKLVAEYIRKHKGVGSVDEPTTYFSGALPMRWGKYTDYSVYFGGVTNKTVLGLVGSVRHVIGAISSDVDLSLSSSGHEIMFSLNMFGNPGPMNGNDLASIARATKNIKGIKQNLEFLAVKLVEGYEGYMLFPYEEPPTQFITLNLPETRIYQKPRPEKKDKRMKVILGSPIYVALYEH